MSEETVIVTCTWCGGKFEQLRWQFEVDVEEEGDNYEPCCPRCCGLEEEL